MRYEIIKFRQKKLQTHLNIIYITLLIKMAFLIKKTNQRMAGNILKRN